MTRTDRTGLTDREFARITKLIAKHEATIAEASRRLATDYETPAQRIISAACAEMGIARLDWERITAVQGNHEFEKPPARLLARWARY